MLNTWYGYWKTSNSLFIDTFAGNKRKNASNGHAVGDSNNFFADL